MERERLSSSRRIEAGQSTSGSRDGSSCFLGLFTGPSRPRFLTKCPHIQELCERIIQIAATEVAVLIEGESGTGKELVARAIHLYSRRRRNPFVAVNGAAINDLLLGSELFGHVAGAFSGAVADKKGLIEQAEGGVFLIDEASEMSQKVQSELLRWSQEREYRRVGDPVARRVDVRLIAASNQDLSKLVREGKFRQDLYYRFKVAIIRIPPLRERAEDIPLLARVFLDDYARDFGQPPISVTIPAMEVLTAHPWPGNIRELKHCLHGLAVTNRTGRIDADEILAYLDLPPRSSSAHQMQSCGPESAPKNEPGRSSRRESPGATQGAVTRSHRATEEETRRRYVQAYFEHEGNRTAMARALSTSVSQVLRKIRHFRLEK